MGIVGTGHIGCAAARLFRAFGARVVGYARHESEAAREAGIEFVGLADLLEQSDIVSLHVPLTPETRGWFDADKICAMRDGAVLINCARGAIVDKDALAVALNGGKLAGAGIDVFDMEPPLPEGYALASAKNCVLTPHVAYLTEESMQRRAKIEFSNVIDWLAKH